MTVSPDLVVLHEHPEWQKPLFAALERRGVSFEPFDVTRAAFSNVEPPRARALFQSGEPERLRARPRARGAAGAGLHAVAGAAGRARPERVGGVRARAEQERAGDAAADARHRWSALDHVQRASSALQGTSRRHHAGRRCSSRIRAAAARASRSSSRWTRSQAIFDRDPAVWLPDNLFLLQEYCRTIRIRASSAWSFSAASCSTRCA